MTTVPPPLPAKIVKAPAPARASAPPVTPPRSVLKFGLWARLALLFVLAIPAAAALPALLAYQDAREAANGALIARTEAVGRTAASNATYCISGGETECRELVQVLLGLDDVAWVAVIDGEGDVPEGGSGAAAEIGARGLRRVRYRGALPKNLAQRDVPYRHRSYLSVIVPIERQSSGGSLDVLLGGDAPDDARTGGAVEIGFSLASRDEATSRSLQRILKVVVVVVLLALLAAFLVTRFLTKPLLRIARVSENIALGDLRGRVEVKSDDEIGLLSAAFNRILTSMRGALDRINDGSERIDRAAAELVELMSAQRAGAGENLATVHATTAAISGIVASGAEMRQRGRAAIELAGKAIASSEQVAVASHRALEETLGEIDRIRTHVGQLAARVEELEARAEPLGRVVDSTSELADRLHDLSISAAQEAVVLDRAPSAHGRAALTGIVGELRAQSREAQRSASAARRTLAEVQHAIRRARAAAEDGARAVETSSARTRTAETSLEQRGTAIRDISRALRQLADLIQEQLERIEQIFDGVENVRRATAHFNQAADQTLGTARGLTRLSADMKEILSAFRLR